MIEAWNRRGADCRGTAQRNAPKHGGVRGFLLANSVEIQQPAVRPALALLITSFVYLDKHALFGLGASNGSFRLYGSSSSNGGAHERLVVATITCALDSPLLSHCV